MSCTIGHKALHYINLSQSTFDALPRLVQICYWMFQRKNHEVKSVTEKRQKLRRKMFSNVILSMYAEGTCWTCRSNMENSEEAM